MAKIKSLPPIFSLQKYQRFARKFISVMNPYQSLLIFASTGVGKTCSAVLIAEAFREFLQNNQTIQGNIYYVGSNISQENFISTLTGNCGSLASLFEPGFENNPYVSHENENKKELMKKIKASGYNLLTYKGFHNAVTSERIKSIDNSLIIVDEAHNMLNKNEYANALMTVIDKSTRWKLVLLTATPMYNSATDIVDFINLMYPKNERIKRNEIFDSKGKIDDEGLKKIQTKLSGKVSFVRGQQPKNFPKRIDIGTIPSWLKFTKLILVPMSKLQKQKYFNEQSYHELKVITNFVFPSEINEQLLRENLQQYSSKYAKCLEHILKQSSGNEHIFIFSSFVHGPGILLFTQILRANGFIEYGSNINDNTRHYLTGETYAEWKKNPTNIGLKFYPATYFAYHQDVPLDVRSRIIKIFNSSKNIDTKFLKIILGSQLTRESLDLKRIKHVHVLNYQENFSRLEQIIGRAIRFKSHADLPESERTVKVYKYCSIIDTNTNAGKSFEELQYIADENESIIIKKIERTIKIIAIDCNMNHDLNVLSSDVDGSMICDYVECDYKCSNNKFSFEETNFLLQSYDIADTIDLIKNQFQTNIVLSFKYIRSVIPQFISDDIIFQALNYILEEKVPITYKNQKGILVKNGNNYYFQPNIDHLYENNLPFDINIYEGITNILHTEYDITSMINTRILKQKVSNINIIIKELREMIKNNAKESITKQKMVASIYISKLELVHKIQLLEWSIEKYIYATKNEIQLDPTAYTILQYFKRYLLDEKQVDPDFLNNNFSDNYFNQSITTTAIDKGKMFIGHVLSSIPRKYNLSTMSWQNISVEQLRSGYKPLLNEKENPFIVGFIEKNNRNELVFKLRFTNIDKSLIKDKRKIARGFVCNQVNDKNKLLQILYKLGISIDNKLDISILDICEIIERILREKQAHSNKHNLGIRWFYDWHYQSE